MFYNIIYALKAFTVCQILLVSTFLLMHSGRKSKRNLLLVLFISSKALFVLDGLIIALSRQLPDSVISLAGIGNAFQFLLGPAVYLTMAATTDSAFAFRRRQLWHGVPFILYLGLIVSQFQVQPADVQRQLVQQWFPYSAPWFRTVALINYLQFATYGILALRILSRTREDMFLFNSQSAERNIGFLEFLIYDFVVVWGINILSMYFPFGTTGNSVLQIVTVLNIFFIANAIVYQGLRFPQLFRCETETRQKYKKNMLTEAEREEYVKKIKEYTAVEKPYLNPTISLSEFADRLALPPYVVSQVLNTELNNNFYNFINQYRIEECKRVLSESRDGESTILNVLLDCGFNSKSVFNSAFKKHTGMTPREFKRSCLPSPSAG